MAKDPAFLFYSKDWLEGTMEMTPDEKGVYIDLLAHQHQKGTLPSETKRLCKLVGLSESDFLPIWNGIKQKFKPADDDRIHNLRLTGVVTERLELGRKNKIIGILAVAVRKSQKPVELKNMAKKGFCVDDFVPLPDHELPQKITEWFTERLVSLEDGNGNAIEDANIYKNSRDSLGEKGAMLCPEMVRVFKESYPDYPEDQDLDFPACLQIAYKIAKSKGWMKEQVTNGKIGETVAFWTDIVAFSKTDQWYAARSISDFNKEYQRLIQKMNTNGKYKQPAHSVGRTFTPDKF